MLQALVFVGLSLNQTGVPLDTASTRHKSLLSPHLHSVYDFHYPKFFSFKRVIMGSYQLPPISGIPALTTTERAAILDALFEPCTALHTLSVDLLHSKPFDSYDDLIADVGAQLTHLSESPSTSDTEWLDKILGAHPRLGEKKVESAQSQAEQAQLNTGGEEEAAKLRSLNEDYESTFTGLKYV